MEKPICPECNGKGFVEKEAGLISFICLVCKGTKTVEIVVAPEVIANDNTVDIGAGQSLGTTGSPDTSKPKQPKKHKAKKRSRKKSS